MKDKDFIFFIKEWNRKIGESKNDYFIISTNSLY